MRAAIARSSFDSNNWIQTSHQLNNITITVSAAGRASVKAYVEAWHLNKNGNAVLSPGTWNVQLLKTQGHWRIVKEETRIAFAGVLQPFTPPTQ